MIYSRISKFNGQPIPLSDIYTADIEDKITTLVSSLFLANNRKINIWQRKFPFGQIFVKNLDNQVLTINDTNLDGNTETQDDEIRDNPLDGNRGAGDSGGDGGNGGAGDSGGSCGCDGNEDEDKDDKVGDKVLLKDLELGKLTNLDKLDKKKKKKIKKEIEEVMTSHKYMAS
jgi:hypothetical protein